MATQLEAKEIRSKANRLAAAFDRELEISLHIDKSTWQESPNPALALESDIAIVLGNQPHSHFGGIYDWSRGKTQGLIDFVRTQNNTHILRSYDTNSGGVDLNGNQDALYVLLPVSEEVNRFRFLIETQERKDFRISIPWLGVALISPNDPAIRIESLKHMNEENLNQLTPGQFYEFMRNVLRLMGYLLERAILGLEFYIIHYSIRGLNNLAVIFLPSEKLRTGTQAEVRGYYLNFIRKIDDINSRSTRVGFQEAEAYKIISRLLQRGYDRLRAIEANPDKLLADLVAEFATTKSPPKETRKFSYQMPVDFVTINGVEFELSKLEDFIAGTPLETAISYAQGEDIEFPYFTVRDTRLLKDYVEGRLLPTLFARALSENAQKIFTRGRDDFLLRENSWKYQLGESP